MKTISVANLKGGTGKTSFIFNFAGILAIKKRVLLVDGDPQANLTDSAGVDITDPNAPSLLNILEHDGTPLTSIIQKHPIETLPNLDIIPASISLFETENKLFTTASREQQLSHYMEDNAEAFNAYDYILFDTHPNISLINQNIFYASDEIILICDGSMHAITGIQLFQYLWDGIRENLRKPDNIHSLIINGYDQRSTIYSDAFEYCKDDSDLGPLLVKTVMPVEAQIKRTVIFHQPINIYKGMNYKSTKALIAIQKELKKKGVL